MPKKGNTFWVRNKKEKQILTARLIEISLKIEDHIYKQKPISECEAEQYLKEVSSYKGQCSRDERSLQVIEKLSRCMKAIILDYQELRPDNDGKNNGSSIPNGIVSAGSISPVYSIPDEDRTILTQINEENAKNVTEENNDVEIIDLSNIEDDLIHNKSNTTSADYASTRLNFEVDIHRSICNLSLRDVQDPLEVTFTDTDANCSESILNNFEGVEKMLLKKTSITPQGAITAGSVVDVVDKEKTTSVFQAGGKIYNTSFDKMHNKVASICEPSKTVIPKTRNATNKPVVNNTKNNKKYKMATQNKVPKKVTITTDYSLTNTSNQKDNHYTISSQTFYPAANSIPEIQRQTRYDSNKTCTLNSSHTLKDAIHFTQPAQIYKIVNSETVKNVANFNVDIPTNKFYDTQNGRHTTNATESSTIDLINNRPINNSATVQENSTTTKKKRVPRKKKDIDENEIKPKNKKVYRTPKRDKENTLTNVEKKSVPIYNANVVNDLSWIENIRYVREIGDDENDPKLNIEDSFWDNYYLPANWDDNEFL